MIPLLFILGAVLGVAGITRAGAEKRAEMRTKFSVLPRGVGYKVDFFPTSQAVRTFGSLGEGAPLVFNPVARGGGPQPSASVPPTAPGGGGSGGIGGGSGSISGHKGAIL